MNSFGVGVFSLNPARRRRRFLLPLVGAGAVLLGVVGYTRLDAQISVPQDLTELSLDELGALSISAASKHAQPLFETPSAVTVLLSDEIRRYGYSSVADALRAVPGVHVNATDTARWSAGVRGFEGLTSTKLLVLVDGRNLYSPMYGSVAWHRANIPLEDLERIEVVRGPGSSVWGANAVNGIVSVVSKDARATQGTLVSVRDSTLDGLQTYLRYGGQAGDHTWYRVYIRATDTQLGLDPWPNQERANVQETMVGTRVDQEFAETLRFTWQAEYLTQRIYTGYADMATHQVQQGVASLHGLSLLGRMKWQGSEGRELTVQTYFDYNDDNSNSASYRGLGGQLFGTAEDGRTFDLDISHRFRLGPHDLVWGGGFRHSLIDVDDNTEIQLRQPRLTQRRYNLFLQDDVVVVPTKLRLSLGSKLEHHDSVGWQLLPSARISYTPTAKQTWWAAVSRSVRSPSRVESDVRLPYAYLPATNTSPPIRVDFVSDGSMREEWLLAYEAGWRWSPSPRLNFDVATYYNSYHQLRDLRSSFHFETNPPVLVNDQTITNGTTAHGYGTEISAQWRPHDGLRLAATYTLEYLTATTPITNEVTRQDLALPRQLWSLRSSYQVSRDVEASVALHYVDSLQATKVGSYYRFDAQVTWRPRANWEMNVGIQNAFDPKHLEFGALSVIPATEVSRNLYARVQWRF